jgi:ABC-type multidrug transport system ATPase subunit
MAVSAVSVAKSFGQISALQGFTLNVARASVTVLLGPNGAGKTTAIRLITGALTPDAGLISVFGQDPTGPAGESIRRRCGIVSAKPSLYDRLSGWDNLAHAAALYGLGRGRVATRAIKRAAERFEIDHALDQRVGGYSTGMKTRLALARSVLHDPWLLVLDEPTSGLDPESGQAVLALIAEMADDGHTVLLCTHLLAEADGLADSVVFMENGTSLMSGPPSALAGRYWPARRVLVTLADQAPPLAVHDLATIGGLAAATVDGRCIELMVDHDDAVAEAVTRLSASGLGVVAVEPHRPTLEELYFAVRREHRQLDDEAGPRPTVAAR